MVLDIAKFIPAEMRLEIAQKVIRVKGIRPLARELGVNPKSVYKYKQGTSHPTNEIMSKILAVADREESISLDIYYDTLRESFSSALDQEISAEKVLDLTEESSEVSHSTVEESKPASVGPKTTEKSEAEVSVGERSTDEVFSLDMLCEEIGVTTPFNRSKVKKVVGFLKETSGLNLTEIVDLTGLSMDAVERHLELMISKGFVADDSEDGYRLKVEVEEGV